MVISLAMTQSSNLLWLAIINIEDKRVRERARLREESGKRSDHPARLIEGQKTIG